jgi:DNA repair ATPase RecN
MVLAVEGEERVDELASMLGGVTDENRAAARALRPSATVS